MLELFANSFCVTVFACGGFVCIVFFIFALAEEISQRWGKKKRQG